MRKRMAVFAFGLMLLLPQGAQALTAEEFENKYKGFLSNTVSASDFLQVCNEALAQPAEPGTDPADEEASIATIRSFQYLALMKLENYYAASLVAELLRDRFGDMQSYHEMMLSICTRRDALDQGLEHARALIALGRKYKADVTDYQAAERALLQRKAKVKEFTATRFWQAVANDRDGAGKTYAGVPLVISGQAVFKANADKSVNYIVFDIDGDGKKWITCQLPMNEIPFLQNLRLPGPVRITASFLSASDKVIVLYPSRYLK